MPRDSLSFHSMASFSSVSRVGLPLNRKWVTNITYLPTVRGWVYPAVVIDLFSRKVVGWSIGDSLTTGLMSGAMCRHSPLSHVGNVSAPTLILHSREDRHCPIAMGKHITSRY